MRSALFPNAPLTRDNVFMPPYETDLWTYPRSLILAVVDADTFHAEIDLGLDSRRRMTLRLADCDAPETRLTEGVTAAEKEAGLYMRDALRERLIGQTVTIQTIKDRKEKYGRYLANVWHEGEWVNAWVREQSRAWVLEQ